MKTWSEDVIKRLLELRARGLSSTGIAKELGDNFTKNSVLGKLHRMGLLLTTVGYDHAQRIRDGIRTSPKRKLPKKKSFAYPNNFPRYPIPAETEDAPSTAIKFADLDDHHCRYPFGSGLSALYCGKEKTLGSSYCVSHHLKCYPRNGT